MNANRKDESALVAAVRDVLADCPQDEPQAAFYDSAEEFAAARALWRVAGKLRPALVITTGSPS